MQAVGQRYLIFEQLTWGEHSVADHLSDRL